MLRSNFLCSLASSDEPHVVMMRVGGRVGQSRVRELKADEVKPCVGLTYMGPLTG